MVVALNMVDEAKSQGIKVDRDLLEHLLGVPVVETIAIAKKGMDELKSTINNAQTGTISHNNLKDKLVRMKAQVACQGEALLILEGDPVIAQKHGIEPGHDREEIYLNRRERVNDVVGHVVTLSQEGVDFKTKLGRWMITPLPVFLFFWEYYI